MNSTFNERIFRYLSWALLSITGAWVLWRAANISMTHDESATFLFVYESFWDLFQSEKCFGSGNNHILNSFLTKICYNLFGASELSLRLPNVLAFGLYAYSGYSLLKLWTKSTLEQFLGLLILLCFPFMLDFFSLCRGYGLAMAWVTTSLYMLFQYISLEKYKYLIYSFLFAIIAVLSHFTALNYFVALLGGVVVYQLLILGIQKKQEKPLQELGKALAIALFSTILLGISIAKPISVLREKGEFEYGGTDFLSTLNDFITDFLYHATSDFKLLCTKVLFFLLVLGIAFRMLQLLYEVFRTKTFPSPFFCAFLP